MSQYKFYQPIQIRYNDIDAQGHVNNAKYVTYIEYARFRYIMAVGLWTGDSYLDLGLIVADSHVSYLAPIKLGQEVRVGVRVAAIGNKSLTFEYQIEDVSTGNALATAETIMVSFDYRSEKSTPVSKKWRELISSFEGVIFK